MVKAGGIFILKFFLLCVPAFAQSDQRNPFEVRRPYLEVTGGPKANRTTLILPGLEENPEIYYRKVIPTIHRKNALAALWYPSEDLDPDFRERHVGQTILVTDFIHAINQTLKVKPGRRVDVLAHSYSFAFELWPIRYPYDPEILKSISYSNPIVWSTKIIAPEDYERLYQLPVDAKIPLHIQLRHGDSRRTLRIEKSVGFTVAHLKTLAKIMTQPMGGAPKILRRFILNKKDLNISADEILYYAFKLMDHGIPVEITLLNTGGDVHNIWRNPSPTALKLLPGPIDDAWYLHPDHKMERSETNWSECLHDLALFELKMPVYLHEAERIKEHRIP